MNEKSRILEMVKEGKISAEEAEKLLDAIYTQKPEPKKEVEVQINKSSIKDLKGKLVISVESHDGDNVNVNLPLKLASVATKFIPKNKMADIKAEGIDLVDILSNIDEVINELDGDIVNVESKSGDLVRIYIEK
ncbi:MAG: hypothetical protein JXR48_12965 [Candidatus Delongbacteria bacterium]|nr:hypothetical protein [Candidatus Delongbacteria bacterium]MBN2835864.1 hypothetical protein [Candidatus Delongbacteria bacterium]